MKLGQFDDAAYAYRLIDDPSQAIRDRLAVALVCAEVIRGSGPEALARAAVAGCQLAPASPWPPLLAALGFVIALQGDDAIAHVEAAERRGASEAACRSLRAVCDALGKAAVAQEGDPTARGLATTGAEVVLRLLCGPGATPDRLQDFIRATGEGWIDLCPTDPEPTARLLLAAWCDEGNWDKAVSFADRLVQSGCPWAARLATLVRLRGPGASRAEKWRRRNTYCNTWRELPLRQPRDDDRGNPMEIFVNHRLNPFAFDEDLRRGTHDLGDVLAAAQRMKARAIESTHFLIAVAGVPGGVTQRGLVRLGLSVAQWESGLSHCTTPGEVGDRPVMLAESGLHPSATALLQAAQELCARSGRTRISEPILLLCSLRQATPPVRELLAGADIDLVQWCRELEEVIVPPPPPPVFQATGARGVVTASFSATGRRVLHLLRSETEALGYETADPRHLLLALLALEGGATQYGLFRQGLAPRKVQEAVLLHLRAKAKRTRSCVPIDMAHLQPALSHILGLAGELAGRDRAGRIAEAHILRAFLEIESTARALLADQKVDLVTLGDTAAGYDPSTDDEDRGEAAIADIETVRTHLKERIVGQDHAIDQIVPYIEFMRFGLTTPGHPIGVFLFCGQSGSGKTEMAKELARAVYGSEEDLIFLEMGQFNSPESMNIFVGAPPGFIGYGEGKLTNGLRDKPKAVVLFDEVEKAHKKVNDALLRFLDEGKIDDPAGPVRDGSQCIVILTSNVSSEHLDAIWQRVAGRPAWRTEIRRASAKNSARTTSAPSSSTASTRSSSSARSPRTTTPRSPIATSAVSSTGCDESGRSRSSSTVG